MSGFNGSEIPIERIKMAMLDVHEGGKKRYLWGTYDGRVFGINSAFAKLKELSTMGDVVSLNLLEVIRLELLSKCRSPITEAGE